jgi:hypothetical protein
MLQTKLFCETLEKQEIDVVYLDDNSFTIDKKLIKVNGNVIETGKLKLRFVTIFDFLCFLQQENILLIGKPALFNARRYYENQESNLNIMETRNFVKDNLGADSKKLLVTIGTPPPQAAEGEKQLNETTLPDYAGLLNTPAPPNVPVMTVPSGKDSLTIPSHLNLFKK